MDPEKPRSKKKGLEYGLRGRNKDRPLRIDHPMFQQTAISYTAADGQPSTVLVNLARTSKYYSGFLV